MQFRGTVPLQLKPPAFQFCNLRTDNPVHWNQTTRLEQCARASENMVITSDTLRKPQIPEQATKVEKGYVRVRCPAEHGIQDLLFVCHITMVLSFG